MKLHILKVTDRDDSTQESFHTIKSLRELVLTSWYDTWAENHYPHEQDYTKEQIANSDEDLFSYLNSWNFDVERIYIVTEKDL